MLVQLHDGTLLVPTIQLDEAFDLNAQIADRTQRLIEWGMGPWAIWDWWHTPNGWLLDGQSPADAVRGGDFDAVGHENAYPAHELVPGKGATPASRPAADGTVVPIAYR